MIVFSFDRDDTVDLDSSEKGVVPLEWIEYLRDETDHEVWTHDYKQVLRDEADLPGIEEALQIYNQRWGDPVDQIDRRTEPKLEEWVPEDVEDKREYHPDPDVVTALYHWQERGKTPKRYLRLRIISQLFPDAEQKICIDNVYLQHLHEWTHFYPWTFFEFVDLMTEMTNAGEIELARKMSDGELMRHAAYDDSNTQPTTTAQVLHLGASKLYRASTAAITELRR